MERDRHEEAELCDYKRTQSSAENQQKLHLVHLSHLVIGTM